MTEKSKKVLIKSQQGELDGVETYLMLAETSNNETDKEKFKELAADEGRHASVFRRYTEVSLKPGKLQARAVVILYHLIGKRALYPLIARFEYAAIPRYEKLTGEYPEVESVKNDEKRHGDTLKALLENGEYEDKPKWPILVGALALVMLIVHLIKKLLER